MTELRELQELLWRQCILREVTVADGRGLFLAAGIKRNRKTQQIKFKVRCNRFIYTLVLKDSDKADKLKQSLPPCALPP